MKFKLFIKNVWQKWLKIGKFIAYINTKILLGLLFYTVFTLYGIFVKLLRKDILDLDLKKNIDTYWKKKELEEMEYFKQY